LNRTAVPLALPLVLLLVLPGARPTLAAPTLLADSTYADRWTLPNGLEVVTREVPGAPDVSVSWGYRFGLDNDPADKPGLASLLAEVGYAAAAGDIPERTREEMESLRPGGWSLKVTRRQTLFSETAKPGQLAGVLRQVATRMRGVTVTDSGLKRARATVRRLMGEKYFGSVDQMLHWQVREYARGLDKTGILTLAAATGLDRETPPSVQQAITRAYAPANGVLALAGDFGGLDLHAILASEFGDLPAGTRLPDPAPVRLDSVTRVVERPEVLEPVGVLGLAAPALADSLHPSFYLSMLVLGGQAKQVWGPASPPLAARFQYAVLDDPDVVRFYPKLEPGRGADPQQLTSAFEMMVGALFELLITRDIYEEYSYNVIWLLGGPMGRSVRGAVARDPAALNLLCVSTASRALWGTDDFWAEYRARFRPAVLRDIRMWGGWLGDPAHQARLLFVPRR
jgi:hypothetical protein